MLLSGNMHWDWLPQIKSRPHHNWERSILLTHASNLPVLL